MDRRAKRVLARTELAGPEPVGEHRDQRGARPVLTLQKSPPGEWLQTPDAEEINGRAYAPDPDRLRPSGHDPGVILPAVDALEGGVLLSILEQLE